TIGPGSNRNLGGYAAPGDDATGAPLRETPSTPVLAAPNIIAPSAVSSARNGRRGAGIRLRCEREPAGLRLGGPRGIGVATGPTSTWRSIRSRSGADSRPR